MLMIIWCFCMLVKKIVRLVKKYVCQLTLDYVSGGTKCFDDVGIIQY